MTVINSSIAPALPLAGSGYTSSYQDRYSNILRLYFNQLDNITSNLLGPLGMGFMDAPHISAEDTGDQYALGDDTPTLVQWDTLSSSSGFTLNPGGYAIAEQDGVYKIDYSLQFANTDNDQHDVFVWLQTNGTVVPNSSSRFTLVARKSASVPSYIVAYSSITFELAEADEIRLWWATEKAYNPTGPVNGIYMEALSAQTSPYVRPANPSAVGSITFVSRLPA